MFSADFTNDGRVNGSDFTVWQRNLGIGSGATQSQGDADGDGDVDAQDLFTWKTQFGSSAATQAVPEASTETLAAVGVVLLRLAQPACLNPSLLFLRGRKRRPLAFKQRNDFLVVKGE